MTKVIVDRTKWTGKDRKDICEAVDLTDLHIPRSDLLVNYTKASNKGHMCCLGFASLVLGASKESIAGRPYPAMAMYAGLEFLNFVNKLESNTHKYAHDALQYRIARINDDTALLIENKETQLIEIFRDKLELELEFIN